MRLLVSFFLSCQALITVFAQINPSPTPLSQQISFQESLDWSPIIDAIGDRRIVAIGESTHGSAEFYILKSELVAHLCREHGFKVMAMEGGLGDINLAYSMIDTMSAKKLRDRSVFPNFRVSEIDPLFDLIVDSQDTPIIYTGFDTQNSSRFFLNWVTRVLRDIDGSFSEQLYKNFSSMYAMVSAARDSDSTGYYKHKEIFQSTMAHALELIDKNRLEIKERFLLNDFQLEIITRSLTMFGSAIELPYSNWYGGIALRDRLMAENLIWLADEVYPEEKIIIWAHNGHVEKNPSSEGGIKWMGHFLKEKYGDDYYALGLFAQKGEAYQHWTQETVSFDNDKEGFIEHAIHPHSDQTYFIDILSMVEEPGNSWLFNTISGFELESNGQVQFIPAKRFDGVICIPKSSKPTFD